MATTAGWLLTYLLHSTLLLAGAWLLDRWSAVSRDPRIRSWVWRTAMIGGLATATVAQVASPPGAFRVTASEAEKVRVDLSVAAATGGPERPVSVTASTSASEQGGLRAVSPYEGRRLDPREWLHGIGHDWPYLLIIAALLAGCVTLAGRGWALWRLSRRLGSRKPVESPSITGVLAELQEGDGAQREVSLTRSDAITSPLALPGGEICLPAQAAELEDGEVRALLAHELAHLRRRDPAALLALAAVEALLAVQPLNRLARRRLTEIAETRTDDCVRAQGLGTELASTLVTVGSWVRARHAGGPPVAGLASESGLEGRVRRLLDPALAPRERGRSSALVSLAGAAAVLASIFLLTPGTEVATPSHATLAPDGGGDGESPLYCEAPLAGSPVDGGEACTVPAGDLPPGAGEALAGGPGLGLYLSVEDADAPLRLWLRPGGSFVRWYSGSGRQLALPLPGGEIPDGRVVTLRVSDPPGDEHVLYVPPSVRRLTLVVNGRVVETASVPEDGELPRLVVPDAPTASGSS